MKNTRHTKVDATIKPKDKLRDKLNKISENEVDFIPLKNEKVLCKVVDVYDGDTCTIIYMVNEYTPVKTKIRIDGIDTPEKRKGKKTTPLENEVGHLIADYVSSLILNKILFVVITDFDKYGGRMLGRLYIGECDNPEVHSELLSEHLLSKGFAKEYHGDKKKPWTQEELNIMKNKFVDVFT